MSALPIPGGPPRPGTPGGIAAKMARTERPAAVRTEDLSPTVASDPAWRAQAALAARGWTGQVVPEGQVDALLGEMRTWAAVSTAPRQVEVERRDTATGRRTTETEREGDWAEWDAAVRERAEYIRRMEAQQNDHLGPGLAGTVG